MKNMNKKGQLTIIILMVLVVAAVLIVGGILLSKPSPNPNPTPAPNQTPNPNPNITNSSPNQIVNSSPINNSVSSNLSVVQANNQFAFDLYKNWASNEGNMFFSPYSISSALAMTYEGARGKTADEMQNVLHFPTDQDARRNGFSQINSQLNGQDKPYALSTANALWAQKDYPFSSDYLSLVAQYYGGNAANLDFIQDAEGSRKTINTWVENKTNDKIVDLIPPGAIDSLTRLVLTNAIYFKANWTNQFEKEATSNEDFKTNDNTVNVPTMHQQEYFNYAETSDLQVLEMPYLGGDLSMLIILPKTTLDSVESSLNQTLLEQLRSDLKIEKVDVSLPRFNMETKYSMSEDLAKMGMPTAFSVNADFSGMTTKEKLFISAVIHQAFVNVTEQGTEAAAATAVMIAGSGYNPAQPKIFKADHPFIFIIQQKDTGNILFIGRVSDPSK